MAQSTQPAGRVTTPTVPDIPIRKPTALWLTPRFIIGFLIAIAAYAYGTQLTGINFVDLVRNLPKAERIVTQLLQPEFFEVETTVVSDRISIVIPGETVAMSPPTRAPKDGPQVALSNRVVKQGETVELTGTGWPPNATVILYWDEGQNQTPISQFQTDAQGNFSVPVIIPQGEAQGIRFIEARVQTPEQGLFGLPAWTLTPTARLSIEKMIETIFLALIGTTFTVILTAPLSFLGARNIMHGSKVTEAIYYVVRTFFNILRSIEVLILAVIWAVVVGIGSFAGVLAITIHGIGALGKLYSEAIESIEPGPIEALRATGASRLQVVMYAVLPQVIPQFISFTFYRWDINVRMATVLGLVGGGGIGFILIQFINLLQWPKAATAIWLIVIVVMVMDSLSSYIRHKVV
jgi:phosphonate transport system permease protein